MALVDELREESQGELRAAISYRDLAIRLRIAGHYSEGNLVDSIADDEDKHANLLMTMADSIVAKQEPEEIKLSGEMIEVPLGRPVPQTYGDWVNLGMDIKEKAGIDDFKTTAEVNEHLYHIYKEEEDPATAQVSKMWLTRKAGELGIK